MPPGFPRRALLLLLLLTLVLRVGTNLSRVDEYFQEGLIRGALTAAWLRDAPVWPSQMPQIPHIRGSVVMSALSVPAFVLLGPTTFAVRISGILFHCAALLGLMLLTHRLFGRLAAVLAGCMWVLAPPSLAKIAVLSYGDHVEGLAFLFPAVWALVAWTSESEGRRRGAGMLAGVLVGLCVSWHAQSRLGAAALVLTCVAISPRRFFRADAFAGLLPGLLLGLVPMAIGDWVTAQPGLFVAGSDPVDMLSKGLSWERIAKWRDLWLQDLPRSLQFPSPVVGAALFALAGACALGLLVGAVRRVRRGEEGARAVLLRDGFFVVYPLLFSVAYATSRFEVRTNLQNAIPVRYVLPIVPGLLLPIAVAAARLAGSGRRGAATVLFAPALALGAWGSLSTWSLDAILHEPARNAVSFEFFAEHFVYGSLEPEEQRALRRLELSLYGDPGQRAAVQTWVTDHADTGRYLAFVNRFDDQPEWTRPLRYPLPIAPWNHIANADTPAEMLARFDDVPAPLRVWVAAQVGRRLGHRAALADATTRELIVAGRTREESLAMWRGFGRGLPGGTVLHLYDGEAAQRRLSRLPRAVDLREVAFGLGLYAGSMVNEFYANGEYLLTGTLEHFEPELLAPFARGVGAGYRWRLLEPPTADLECPAVNRLISVLGRALEAPFRAGLGGSPDAY